MASNSIRIGSILDVNCMKFMNANNFHGNKFVIMNKKIKDKIKQW